MRERISPGGSIQPSAATGRDPFFLCRLVVPALLLSACLATGASVLSAGSAAGHYLGIYSNLTPLIGAQVRQEHSLGGGDE